MSNDPPDIRDVAGSSAGTSPLLEIKNLHFSYPERALFQGLSARISPGVTLVRGGDAAGKTTLLRLLAGELQPASGEIVFSGDNIQPHVFWVDPRTDAFDSLTVVAYLQAQRRRYPAFDDEALGVLVDGLALEPQMNKQLFMLSTGSKRKVFLAAAFASGAPLTLLDMPFAALDKASIGFVIERLEDAAGDSDRALVMADYEAPGAVRLDGLIDLGD